MLTIKNQVAFKLLLPLACLALLAGCKPPGPKALWDGKRLLDKGQVPAAIERLQVAAELLRTNATAWNYLGIAYHQAGQTTNALLAYKRALEASPDLMESRLNLGTLWLEQGRAAEAKSEFTAYTLRRPTAPEGFRKLAVAELRLREVTLAEQHIRKALQLDSASPEAWNTLGLIQFQQHRARDAALSFTDALKRQADFGPALLNLAIVSQQQLGDRAAALKGYRQYLALKPRPADAGEVTLLARQLELELAPPRPAPVIAPAPATQAVQTAAKPVATNSSPTRPTIAATPAPKVQPVEPKPVPTLPAAVRTAPTLVTLAPEPVIKTSPAVETKTAVAPVPEPVRPVEVKVAPVAPTAPVAKAEKRGFFQSINPVNLFRRDSKAQRVTPLPGSEVSAAVEVSESGPAVRTVPSPAAASNQISVVAAAGTSPVPAGSSLRYAYRGGGNREAGDRAAAEKFASQGSRELASKRYAQACAAFASAAQADPGWFQAHFNHAVAALEAGRTLEALAAGENALAVQPDSADARYNFALALKRGGFAQDAAIELERLLAANPNDVRAHLMLGNLYAEQLRRPDQARAHYLKVLALEPRHPRGSAIRFWLAANPAK